MANEYEGVSPASAGGAPARPPVPEPFRRMFWVAAEDIANVIGCTVVEGEARDYGEPDPRDTDPGKLREIANALHALLGEEDCTERAVTPGHLWYLVRLVAGHLDAISDRNRPGPPKLDPRDAEIEQLRTALAIEQRDLLNEMDEHRTAGALLAEAREEWKRADAEVTRLKRLVGDENVLYDGWDGLGRQDAIVRAEEGWQEYLKVRDELAAIREALGPLHGDRSMGDTDAEVVANLRAAFTEASRGVNRQSARANEAEVGIEHWQGLAETRGAQVEEFARSIRELVAERDRKRRELADVATNRDRWQARYNRLIGGALAVQQHLQRAAGKPVPAGEEFDKDYSRSMVDELVVERDRLRQELDRVGEKHAAGLVTLRTDFTAAVNGLLPKPAEPRRWTYSDPEPEIGTTVLRGDLGVTFTRRTNGNWGCNERPSTLSYNWDQVISGPVVEVVGTDGD